MDRKLLLTYNPSQCGLQSVTRGRCGIVSIFVIRLPVIAVFRLVKTNMMYTHNLSNLLAYLACLSNRNNTTRRPVNTSKLSLTNAPTYGAHEQIFFAGFSLSLQRQ